MQEQKGLSSTIDCHVHAEYIMISHPNLHTTGLDNSIGALFGGKSGNNEANY